MRPLLRSLRILRKNWKLTAIAIFSLSIAMALAVISLSVSNTSLLVPPAGVAPDRLVTIYARTPESSVDHFSYPDYEYYRDNNRVFADVAAIPEGITAIRTTLSGADDASAQEVIAFSDATTANYFAVLGLRPLLGRFFSTPDYSSKASVCVLTYSYWTRLGSDPNIVGKELGGTTIIGVAPKQFTGSLFGLNADMVTLVTSAIARHTRDYRDLIFLARLKPGVSRSQAQAEMTLLSAQLAAAYPKEDKNRSAVVTRATLLPPDAIRTTELLVAILLILVLLVLLIACANVSNLLLALAVGRRQEATIKIALGSSRGRLIREFLRESTVICVVSGALGFVLAEAVILRYSTINVDVPGLGPYSVGLKLHLGLAVISATMALMLMAIFTTGLPAALYASSTNLSQILSGEIVVGGAGKALRRKILMVAQVAVCTLVLVGMGLCERSLYNLRSVDPGFAARNLVVEALYPGDLNYTEAQGKALYTKVRQSVSNLPGVQSVTLALNVPFFGNDSPSPVKFPNGVQQASAMSNIVDADYFATFGIPIVAGRAFGADDTSRDTDALIVNHKLAETLWPGREALGRELLTGDPPRKAVVVGVVADSKYDDLTEQPQPFIYYAASQHYQAAMNLVARTSGDPRLWIEAVSKSVAGVSFDAVLRPVTFQNIEDLSILPQRIVAGCVAGLSGLGLLLAIVGLFGAISYSVSERRKDLGIRVALGARPAHLLKMIFRETLIVTGTGTAIGIALGIATTLLLRSEFFGIDAVELSVLVPVAAAMLSVSLAVAYLSARPWIKVDAMEAIRHT